ncbi:MarR family transcriptional regulator [soil metagenome]
MSTAINHPNHPNSTAPGFSLPVTDAVLTASRVLVAVAARSLATVDQKVTLVQYRALVVLASDPQTVGELAAALNVHPSTATRTCDRLVAKGLIRRAHDTNNRREVRVSLTASGRRIVDEVATLRRAEIERIVQKMTPSQCEAAISSLTVFADAAGEARQADWALGWP